MAPMYCTTVSEMGSLVMKINVPGGNRAKVDIADRFRPPTADKERKGLGGMTKIRIVDEKPAEHETNQESDTSND